MCTVGSGYKYRWSSLTSCCVALFITRGYNKDTDLKDKGIYSN